MTKLSEEQLSKLSHLFSQFLESCVWPLESTVDGEVAFTSNEVLPRVKQWLKTLRRNTLVIRSDGEALQPLPLSLLSATFRPDLEIVEHSDRLIALEVKFIKQNDPSGSIAKAIGQALLYKTVGSKKSFALLIDLRGQSSNLVPGEFESVSTGGGVVVYRARPK